jgi:hypothetical protein
MLASRTTPWNSGKEGEEKRIIECQQYQNTGTEYKCLSFGMDKGVL